MDDFTERDFLGGPDDMPEFLRQLLGMAAETRTPEQILDSQVEGLTSLGFTPDAARRLSVFASSPDGMTEIPDDTSDEVEVTVRVSSSTLKQVHNAIGFTLVDALNKHLQTANMIKASGVPLEAVIDTDMVPVVERGMIEGIRFLADLKAGHALAGTVVPDDISSLTTE